MIVYATADDLATWISPATVPANATGLLRSASGLIRHATKQALYATVDGAPSLPDVAAAFRDATTAQAKFWADNGVDPSLGAAGVAPVAASKSIGGASIAYADATAAAEARAGAADTLAPDAFYILNDAGLLGGMVQL